jgi:hypothetical protein
MRCAGNSMVMRMVSRIQPRMSLRVSQWPSPFPSFLVDAGSRRNSSSVGSNGRKTSSRVWRRTRRVLMSRSLLPCAVPMKSLTKMSNF